VKMKSACGVPRHSMAPTDGWAAVRHPPPCPRRGWMHAVLCLAHASGDASGFGQPLEEARPQPCARRVGVLHGRMELYVTSNEDHPSAWVRIAKARHRPWLRGQRHFVHRDESVQQRPQVTLTCSHERAAGHVDHTARYDLLIASPSPLRIAIAAHRHPAWRSFRSHLPVSKLHRLACGAPPQYK